MPREEGLEYSALPSRPNLSPGKAGPRNGSLFGRDGAPCTILAWEDHMENLSAA